MYLQNEYEDKEMSKARAEYDRKKVERLRRERSRGGQLAVILLLVCVGTATASFWFGGLAEDAGFERSSAIYRGWISVGSFVSGLVAVASGCGCIVFSLGVCFNTLDLRSHRSNG